ncbi:hypothetical protein FBEOM_11347 [Fusarium beomiforme]|uniref:Uncharacterized protein n=1 Tax=Fusarium beomiforme TaxID=44412 RepID=A0A9P5AA73_9HYPO|nr:hypothetical protein FBEOM_11347 [Fusarium beomiforme]
METLAKPLQYPLCDPIHRPYECFQKSLSNFPVVHLAHHFGKGQALFPNRVDKVEPMADHGLGDLHKAEGEGQADHSYLGTAVQNGPWPTRSGLGRAVSSLLNRPLVQMGNIIRQSGLDPPQFANIEVRGKGLEEIRHPINEGLPLESNILLCDCGLASIDGDGYETGA